MDLFDEVLRIEEGFEEEGAKLGKVQGERDGREEGIRLGLEAGARWTVELEFYRGALDVIKRVSVDATGYIPLR